MLLLRTMLSNHVLNVAMVSWVLAQICKAIVNFIKTKEFNSERLFGAGGMPSSHSATVSGVMIATAQMCGFSDPLFGISAVLAAVVMYDAMGIRRAAGEQAKALNRVIDTLEDEHEGAPDDEIEALPVTREEKRALKEYLGHTPLEVLAGALLGILIAMTIPMAS